MTSDNIKCSIVRAVVNSLPCIKHVIAWLRYSKKVLFSDYVSKLDKMWGIVVLNYPIQLGVNFAGQTE